MKIRDWGGIAGVVRVGSLSTKDERNAVWLVTETNSSIVQQKIEYSRYLLPSSSTQNSSSWHPTLVSLLLHRHRTSPPSPLASGPPLSFHRSRWVPHLHGCIAVRSVPFIVNVGQDGAFGRVSVTESRRSLARSVCRVFVPLLFLGLGVTAVVVRFCLC